MTALNDFFTDVKLPTISQVAHELIQTLGDEEAGAQEIGRIVSRDPALTAKVLRLANSARFGASRAVSSVQDAISLAGMDQIRTLALAACFAQSFPDLPGLDAKEFWADSMNRAGYAKWLAAGAGVDASQAWLTGMMLRLGELLIYQADPKAFEQIEQLPHLPGGRWERESRLLGFSEGEITAELARRWNFPSDVARALQTSLDPLAARPFCKLGAVVHLASLLAEGGEGPDAIDALPSEVVQALRLDAQWMRERLPSRSSFLG